MFSFSQLGHPVIQAPMAGGVNTPEMVANVANLGAVGSYGFAYSTPEKIADDLRAATALKRNGSGAINANFFVFPEVVPPASAQVDSAVESFVAAAYGEDVSFKLPKPPYYHNIEKQLEAVWAISPDIVTFHFGIPPAAILQKARELEISVGITATNVDEARQIERAGADFIVAQGIEAGGHRGVFDPAGVDEQLPIYALSKALRRETQLPVVASGGIMTASHIQRARDSGAIAVQMGTAFLTTRESGASAAHKRYLLNASGRSTQLTRGFSGRIARGIDNRFIRDMAEKPTLPFPLQNTLTGMMRAAAVERDDGEFQSLWSGSNFSECRDESIAELLQRLFP